ncbi:hypothetical protein ILYODFUR_035007 [Ilyodon furcidens]|uniref:Uncharacterized protein n=1 Tax=Ilyodon furcidens TaxID=33524 RepID=A0ABV0VBI1_9TELE
MIHLIQKSFTPRIHILRACFDLRSNFIIMIINENSSTFPLTTPNITVDGPTLVVQTQRRTEFLRCFDIFLWSRESFRLESVLRNQRMTHVLTVAVRVCFVQPGHDWADKLAPTRLQ